MLVEGSKALVGRLYEEAQNIGVFWVMEESKFYHLLRKQVQHKLSTAQTMHLWHDDTTT